jgi:hypothetical protein
MTCQYCSCEHDGTYGSGRFCRKFCAAGFATRARRAEINAKVSVAIKALPPWIRGKGYKFKSGHDPRRGAWTPERIAKANETRKKSAALLPPRSWEQLGKAGRRTRVLSDQGGRCVCGLNEWRGRMLVLEIHHIDGDDTNNSRENVEALCPNCHSQTPNFRRYSYYR